MKMQLRKARSFIMATFVINPFKGCFKQENIEAVMHCADSLVGVSMEKPLQYYNNNVYGALCLLEVMDEIKVDFYFLLLRQRMVR